MNNKLMPLLLGLFLSLGLLVGEAFGQAKTVKGVVVAADEEENPIMGAALVIKGTTKGTTTGRDGSFTLEIPAGFDVISVSYVGFIAKEVKVEDDLELIIRLSPEPPKGMDALAEGAVLKKDKARDSFLFGSNSR
ncbi:MAG: carboxypeptidase-like regulatory domain-containing protein [Nitritalea sp.]